VAAHFQGAAGPFRLTGAANERAFGNPKALQRNRD